MYANSEFHAVALICLLYNKEEHVTWIRYGNTERFQSLRNSSTAKKTKQTENNQETLHAACDVSLFLTCFHSVLPDTANLSGSTGSFQRDD